MYVYQSVGSCYHDTGRSVTHHLQGEWKAVGTETSTKFSGIDLTEGDWYDYDEKAGEEVGITNVKWEIRRA